MLLYNKNDIYLKKDDLIMYQSSNVQDLYPRINQILKSARPRKHAVVFDIDATVLYNSSSSYCGADPNFNVQWIYDYCVQHAIPVYFVTARVNSAKNRKATINQLTCMGFNTYKKLYMRPQHVSNWAQISQFKANARRNISRDYEILLNVGDNWSDLHEVDNAAALTRAQEMSRGQYVLFKPFGESKWALKLVEP